MAKKKASKATAKKTRRTGEKRLEKRGFAAAQRPPYICVKTLEDGVCLRYEIDPEDGRYVEPPTRVACSTCRYFGA